MESERCIAKQCEPVRDTPEIQYVISSIDDVICRYNNVVERLSNRLSCITTAPSPNGNTKSESTFKTSLANDLDNLRSRLRDITNELESIYDRLEI